MKWATSEETRGLGTTLDRFFRMSRRSKLCFFHCTKCPRLVEGKLNRCLWCGVFYTRRVNHSSLFLSPHFLPSSLPLYSNFFLQFKGLDPGFRSLVSHVLGQGCSTKLHLQSFFCLLCLLVCYKYLHEVCTFLSFIFICCVCVHFLMVTF